MENRKEAAGLKTGQKMLLMKWSCHPSPRPTEGSIPAKVRAKVDVENGSSTAGKEEATGEVEGSGGCGEL